MMEFALSAHGAEIYTVETLDNNLYLLDDLKPDLILFDVETCRTQLSALAEYSSSAKTQLVGVGSESDQQIVSGMVKSFLTKPFEAKNLASRILLLLD